MANIVQRNMICMYSYIYFCLFVKLMKFNTLIRWSLHQWKINPVNAIAIIYTYVAEGISQEVR